MKPRRHLIITVLLASTSVVNGQAGYVENFDDNGTAEPGQAGPPNLMARGWIFRDQSSPPVEYDMPFNDGNLAWMPSYNGTGYLGASYSTATLQQATVNEWAILPPVPNQMAGDAVSVWLRRVENDLYHGQGRIEVRYSPSGGTNTGSSPTDVGDFTTVLIDVNPVQVGSWANFTSIVPGAGRLAIRLSGSIPPWYLGTYCGIDALRVGTDPCTLPPLPAPGQTVHWTPAGSPYRICSEAVIPAGGTLVIDPGVRVNFDANQVMIVRGTLNAPGTATQRITLNGQANGLAGEVVRIDPGGSATIAFATIDLLIEPMARSFLSVSDSRFQGGSSAGIVQKTFAEWWWVVLVNRCTFPSGRLELDYGTFMLRDTTFTGSMAPTYIPLIWGYGLIENLQVTGASLWVNDRSRQPAYLGNVRVSNANGAGLWVVGGDYFLGPDTVLQNNVYPIHLDGGGGILPGSTVPATGNVNNYVAVAALGPAAYTPFDGGTWAPLPIPYVVGGNLYPDRGLTILPGATVQMRPYAAMVFDVGSLAARGLPDAPVTFERFDPAQIWDGILFCGSPRLEYAIVDGAEFGAFVDPYCGTLEIDNCIFRNNQVGSFANLPTRKTQFLNNYVGTWSGALNGQTNPNAFVGNAQPLPAVGDARFNWWGDPSGPTSSNNPGGTGDPAGAGLQVVPFLTSPPDFSDHPPVVHVKPASYLFETGQKAQIAWEAWDNSAVVVQRVEYTDPDTLQVSVIANLPGDQRALEWTVPAVPPFVGGANIRITAIDDAGQEGWAAMGFTIPSIPDAMRVNPVITSDVGGRTFTCGEVVPLTMEFNGPGPSSPLNAYGWLSIDGEQRFIPLGAMWDAPMPLVSTDSARYLIVYQNGSLNAQEFAVSPYFSIRPDARIGDAPPSVAMLTPTAGATYAGGSIVPITWTASDDEQLRSFTIVVSYDDGRTWHVISKDLPGSATSFDWVLPPGTGVAAVRVRLVAEDLRFQTSSSGADRVFAILPGPVPGDIDGNGLVNAVDVDLFVAVLLGLDKDPNHGVRSDLNGDGSANGMDTRPLIAAVLGG